MSKNYIVTFNNPIETHDVAIFSSIKEAKEYIDKETNGHKKLDLKDIDNGNNHFWYEVYEDYVINDNGEYGNEVYESDGYYY